MIRWSATVYYRTENWILDVIHEVGNFTPNLTVEEAMKL